MPENPYFKKCEQCDGTGKVPGTISPDGRTFSAYNCTAKGCCDGYIITPEGRAVIDLVKLFFDKGWEPFGFTLARRILEKK